MVDIHTHVIPFVDDGSHSMEDSLRMLREEIANGVTAILCTPHHNLSRKYLSDVPTIRKNFELLKEEAKKNDLPVNLYLGMEICYTHREDILGMLQRGELLTLNGSNRILLEFSFTRKPEDFDEIVYRFYCAGYKVIIAHVERYEWMTPETVRYLKDEGALIQVNTDSILGKQGLRIKMLTHKLLKAHLVDYIASDTHSFRPSSMEKARRKVRDDSLFGYDGSLK